MRRSSDRAQAEPFAALAAVFAASVGLALYAGALADASPEAPDRAVPDETLDRILRHAETAGVIDPGDLNGTATAPVPDGWHANVTLRTPETSWRAGPAPPDGPSVELDRATRRVSVRVRPGRVRPGRIGVVVWR